MVILLNPTNPLRQLNVILPKARDWGRLQKPGPEVATLFRWACWVCGAFDVWLGAR